MKKRIFSVLTAFFVLFSMFPAYSAYAADAEKAVTVWYTNPATETMEEADKVELYSGGEVNLSAKIKDGISGDIQWQIKGDNNTWFDIQDGTEKDLRVSYGMVQGLLKNDSVRMRCAVLGEEEYYSDAVKITVTEEDDRVTADSQDLDAAPVAPEPLPAPVATPIENKSTEETSVKEKKSAPVLMRSMAAPAAAAADETAPVAEGDEGESEPPDETKTYYTVIIEYVYSDKSQFDGQRVALPYIAEVESGDTLSAVVNSPNCVGYNPDIATVDLSTLGAITKNETYTVKYSPAEVSYTVRHYQQNVDDDEYTWVDTTMATGYTEALTSDAAAKTYAGFTALSHYHEEIAADSSTMIDIYYDRNYYLMSFDLDGGYGVESIYARYGADVLVGEPYKAGWDFAGWNGDIPSTMPNEDRTYTASWSAQTGIGFTVAYWLEDANIDGKYNFWGSTTQTANAGATVQGDTYKDYTKYLDQSTINNMDTYEKRYSYYNHADTDVVVKGDGSTVVNVYYNRNEYKLKFYYAARTGNEGSYTYKIYGGSTYFFGQDNSNSYNGDELELLNAIYTNDSYDHQWGEVTSEPVLNTLGDSRDYKFDYDTKNNVDFLYLSFTAKYGQDISALWPCNVFEPATRSNPANSNGWSGTKAFVSAWNGEHHVFYSHHNANETIKGNYNELDYKLLFDNCGTHNYPDSDTVAYLCFWENGSGDVGWNVPELYRYNIYVPVLTGDEPNQTDDNKYYLWTTYDTCDDSTVAQQTAPAINGYTYTGNYTWTELPEKDLYDENGNQIYREAYAVNFFYSRNQFELKFENGGKPVKTEKVPFGTALSSKAPEVTYHDEALKDVYEFDGWYTSSDTLPESKFELTNATMPANSLILYAGWKKITKTINIYDSVESTENGTAPVKSITVSYDELVDADDRPRDPISTDERAFIGWYYKDEVDAEHRFDFATMTVTQDMDIYAKWRSNVMKEVVINYVVEDKDGTQIQIADSETLKLRLGQIRTFEAKTGNSLYTEYRTGCFPTTSSHSITIEEDNLATDTPVEYTFVYKQYGKIPYQVEFYLVDKDGKERPAFKNVDGKAEFVEYGQWSSDFTGYVEQHKENNKAIVTELYIPDDLAVQTWTLPDAYLPDHLKVQKIIIPSENDPENNIAANTIKFVYTYTEPEDPDNPVYKARYLIQHFVQDPVNTDEYMLYSYKDESGDSGDTVKASPISIPGYTYDYEVTNANKKTGTELNEATREMTGVIDADDSLELNFYYKANPYPYKVMYLEEGSNRELAQSKTLGADGNKLTGLYGARVTEDAIPIEGYDVVGSDQKSIYIQMEAGDAANVNTIVFYYKQKSANLSISKSVVLDPEQAAQEGISKIPDWVYDQDFEFTVFKKEGFPKSRYEFTVTDADGNEENRTVDADYQTITISLKPGETALIPGLPMGKYDVTETYVPGFVSTVGNTIALTHSVTMNNNGETGTLDFVNRFPFYTGDLVIKKVVKKQDTSDPEATAPYKVSVVLKPQDVAREVDRVITFVDQDGNAVTDANKNSSLTIPKLAQIDEENPSGDTFTIDVLVPVGGEVKLQGVPVGTFIATEEAKTEGYISDYYMVRYNKALHKNDEVIGSGYEISGEIHGGHPTAITYNNTYKKGDLTINKTVTQEYVNDSWNGDTFIFEIEGTTELPDGTYSIKAGGKNDTVTVTGGEIEFTGEIEVSKEEGETSWTESLLYEELPAGYYTVTEIEAKKHKLSEYKVEPPAPKQLVNKTNPGEEVEFSFTNTFKRTTGSLQVGKEIRIVTAGATIDEEQDFTFVVELKDGTLNGDYDCVVKNKQSDAVVTGSPAKLTADKNQLTFTLKHNQYILIDDLPVGNYYVMEEAVEGYDSSFGDVIDNPDNYFVDPAVITTDNTTELECENAYPVYYSNLIVEKIVETPEGHSSIDQAPAGDVFTFTVSISDYSDKISLAGGVRADFYRGGSATPTEDALTVTDNTITFDLKAGEKVDLNLPACDYIIKETGLSSTVNTTGNLAEHYTTDYTVNGAAGIANQEYNLLTGAEETVEFTNTYKRHYLDLTITTPGYAYADHSFIFTVSGTPDDTARFGSNITQKVVLIGEDSQTIKNLPAGEYTVSEQAAAVAERLAHGWSWREDRVNSQTVELRTSDVTVPFEFGVLDRIYWLSDYSYNLHKKGGN